MNADTFVRHALAGSSFEFLCWLLCPEVVQIGDHAWIVLDHREAPRLEHSLIHVTRQVGMICRKILRSRLQTRATPLRGVCVLAGLGSIVKCELAD